MNAFEGCQYGRCPGICIGHVLPRRPNTREVGRILLGIAVMTQPPHLRIGRRVKGRNSAAGTRCDSITPSVMGQLQFHVSKGFELGCPICVSATSAFGAHGLKND